MDERIGMVTGKMDNKISLPQISEGVEESAQGTVQRACVIAVTMRDRDRGDLVIERLPESLLWRSTTQILGHHWCRSQRAW